MNYHPIMAEVEARDIVDVAAFLREELPKRWMAEYKQATPRPTNILRVEIGTFVYMFDFVTELETEGILVADIVREDRLVAGHGFNSADVVDRRDAGRMRGWVGPTEKYLGPGRDKGHVFGRSLGGRVDGLEINLFSQARALNRGWSEEGKLFRRMEQHCAAHPATFCYFRPRYDDNLACPVSVEFGPTARWKTLGGRIPELSKCLSAPPA
jgi:hypothetical protein